MGVRCKMEEVGTATRTTDSGQTKMNITLRMTSRVPVPTKRPTASRGPNRSCRAWLFAFVSAAVFAALLSGNACSRLIQHVSSRQIIGRWEAQFSLQGSKNKSATGIIVLDSLIPPSPTCTRGDDPCSTAHGQHVVDFSSMLGYALPNNVVASVDSDGAIYLIVGRCCDRGELDLRGRLDHGRIRGGWEEAPDGSAHSGSFVLSKADTASGRAVSR